MPPCSEKIITLKFTPVQRNIYNTLVALLKANTVLTQREGPDYIMNSNSKSSGLLLTNLLNACFWVVTEDLNNVQLNDSLTTIRAGLEKNYNEAELVVLRACQEEISGLLESNFFRRYVLGTHDIVFEFDAADRPGMNAEATPSVTGSADVVILKDENDTMPPNVNSSNESELVKNWLSASSLRKNIDKKLVIGPQHILDTSSSKLSYLLQKLHLHQEAEEKTLVFCQLNNEIAGIHEACTLTGISSLLLHKKQVS